MGGAQAAYRLCMQPSKISYQDQGERESRYRRKDKTLMWTAGQMSEPSSWGSSRTPSHPTLRDSQTQISQLLAVT